tara:strand:+ start:146 stop:304 length:159 start_codon:yes stop_codon:yes gene_type:complete
MSMIGIGITSVVAGVAISTYKHYYAKYADLEDMKNIGVQEVVLVSETTEVEE